MDNTLDNNANSGTVKLYLTSKDQVKPYVLLDRSDLAWLSAYKWRFASGYAATTVDGRQVLMHRLILGAAADDVADHKNRLKFDNRRSNLRFASFTNNARNVDKKFDARSTSDYIGVSHVRTARTERWHERSALWSASILGQRLGVFDDEIQAAYVRDQAAMQLFGEFAVLNFEY